MSDFKLNILIVEDSLSFAIELEMLIQEIGYNVIGRADNSADALELIYSEKPDFILMDIDIKGRMTGLQIGAKIKHLEIPILFITSFGDDEHYNEAAQSNMVGYLVKPVDKYSLRTAINLAISNAYLNTKPKTIKKQQADLDNFLFNNCFFFKKRGNLHKVPISDIVYIRSNDNYCETYTKGGAQFITRITISKMCELLPEDQFIRIHRQYIVQLDKIDMIDFQESTLRANKHELPISRNKRKELEKIVRPLD